MVTAHLLIKRPFYGAFKVFKWKTKDWGWGISRDKIKKNIEAGNHSLVIELQDGSQFKVETNKLAKRLQAIGAFNYCGKEPVAYLTKTDLSELARATKSVKQSLEDTNQVEA